MNGQIKRIKRIAKIICISSSIFLFLFLPLSTIFIPSIYVASIISKPLAGINSTFQELFGSSYSGDINEDVDSFTYQYRKNVSYEDLFNCITKSGEIENPKECMLKANENGRIEDDSVTNYQSFIDVNWQEWTGSIPKEVYEKRIIIPAKYMIETQDEEGIWRTNGVVYEGNCEANGKKERCNILRKEEEVEPFRVPTNGWIEQRYGLEIDPDTWITTLNNYQVWSGDPVAITNGEILSITDGEIVMNSTTNGEDLTIIYQSENSGFYPMVGEGKIYSGEIMARNFGDKVKVFIKKEGKYLNPSLFSNMGNQIASAQRNLTESLTVEGYSVNFLSKYYNYHPDRNLGSLNVCASNNHSFYPFDRCQPVENGGLSYTGSWNKMICSSFASSRYWEINYHDDPYPLPGNWDEQLTIQNQAPTLITGHTGEFSRDINNPIPQSIVSITYQNKSGNIVMHVGFIEKVESDGSVIISEANVNGRNEYGFSVRKFSSLSAWVGGAALNGMYGK